MFNQTTLGRWFLAICLVAGLSVTALIGIWYFDALQVLAGQPITIPYLAGKAPLPATPLSIHSSPQQVIALMLNSHTRWHTLHAQAITVMLADYRTNTFETTAREIQIEQYGKVWAQSGLAGQPPTFIWISDGKTMWAEDLIRGTYTEEPVPPPDGQAFVVTHPLEGIIGSALAEYVFPHGLAQSLSLGGLDIIGADWIAGRDTVVVLWQVRKDGTLMKKHKYWIDAQTGIILKGEGYAEIPGWDRWVEQTTVERISYDETIPPEMFTFHPAPGAKRIKADPP